MFLVLATPLGRRCLPAGIRPHVLFVLHSPSGQGHASACPRPAKGYISVLNEHRNFENPPLTRGACTRRLGLGLGTRVSSVSSVRVLLESALESCRGCCETLNPKNPQNPKGLPKNQQKSNPITYHPLKPHETCPLLRTSKLALAPTISRSSGKAPGSIGLTKGEGAQRFAGKVEDGFGLRDEDLSTPGPFWTGEGRSGI